MRPRWPPTDDGDEEEDEELAEEAEFLRFSLNLPAIPLTPPAAAEHLEEADDLEEAADPDEEPLEEIIENLGDEELFPLVAEMSLFVVVLLLIVCRIELVNIEMGDMDDTWSHSSSLKSSEYSSPSADLSSSPFSSATLRFSCPSVCSK